MNNIQRKQARARAEAQAKLRKQIREGAITKQQAKNKTKRKSA